MIYLNSSSEFRGGRTLFFASKLDERIIGSYEPEEGDLIVFDHNLWHSGERLSSGEKYILRSDILYERISPALSIVCGNFREGHLGYIWNVVKGANFYFTAGRDKKIKVWNGKGEKLQELIGHKNSILCLLWTDWNNLISCSRDETIRIWQMKSGRYVSVGEGRFHQGTVLSLCSLGKTEFCSCGSDGKIIVYSDKGTPKLVIEAHDEWVWQVKAITDNIVASISEDGCVKLWQLKPFCLLASLELGNPLTALAHDQKGHILYLGDVKGNVWQVQYTLPKVNLKLLSQHVCHADKILFIKQHGGFLATGSEDNSFALWNKANMSKVFEHPHRNFVQDAHIESGVAITVSYDGQIRRFAIPLSE